MVKIPWYLLKLAYGNKSMGVSWADNDIKIWWNLPISNPKSDLHNINANTKLRENPLMFTWVIIQKRNTNGQTDRQTDRYMDIQHETILPFHYHVAGYKKSLDFLLNPICITVFIFSL